jgi:hypothetical protein
MNRNVPRVETAEEWQTVKHGDWHRVAAPSLWRWLLLANTQTPAVDRFQR